MQERVIDWASLKDVSKYQEEFPRHFDEFCNKMRRVSKLIGSKKIRVADDGVIFIGEEKITKENFDVVDVEAIRVALEEIVKSTELSLRQRSQKIASLNSLIDLSNFPAEEK